MMPNNKFVYSLCWLNLWRCVSLLVLAVVLAACVPANPETAVTPTSLATAPNNLPIATSVSTPAAPVGTGTANQEQPLPDLPTPTPFPATATPEPPQIFSGQPVKVGRGQILDAAFLPDGDSQAIAIGWANGVSLATLNGTERWWQPTDALLIALDASPQGDRIAAILEDGSVVVFSTENGAVQEYAASRPYVYWSDIAFSPDGQQVAFQSIGPRRGDPIYLLDLHNDQVHEVPQSKTDESVKPFLIWSPDGQTLTHAALGENCSRLLNKNTGETQLTLHGESGCYAPWSVAYTPDGQQLAVASPDGGIDLLQADSGQVIAHLAGSVLSQPDQTARVLHFSPAGRWLTTPGGFSFYGDAYPAIVWDVNNAVVQAELPPTERVRKLAQTFAGDELISVYEDGRITRWPFTENNASETAVGQIPVIAPYLDFNWSAHSNRLAAPLRFGGVAVWEATTGNLLTQFAAPYTDPRLSPDGRLLALFTPETQELTLHDLESGELVTTISGAASLPAADPFSPDGQWLAYGSGSELRLLPLSSGQAIALTGYPDDQTIARVIWSLQSDALIAASTAIDERPGTVILWEKTTDATFTAVYQTESMRSSHSCCVTIAAFSPNGERVAFEQFPNYEASSLVVEVYDRQLGKLILREKEYELNAWLSDDVLLTNEGQYDRRSTTWDVVRGQKTISTAYASGGIYAPNGLYYAVVSGSGANIGRAIKVHQWESRQAAGTVNFGNNVIALRWSPDGRWLAALATDSSLWLWPVTLPDK
jgi:WD40 repeat protein